MGLFDIFKKLGGGGEKTPPPKPPSELLEIELQKNLDQFCQFFKETEIGFGKAEFFKTEAWDNLKEESSEVQKKVTLNAYNFIKKMNEELSLLEVKKNGYIRGNISRESKDEGKKILGNTIAQLNQNQKNNLIK
jgi:hypothetical protein